MTANWLIAVGVLWSSTVLGMPRVFAVATGECRDLDLQTNQRAFTDELTRLLSADLLGLQAAKVKLAPEAASSIEDLQRQLETAKMHFYQAHHEKAEEQVQAALVEINFLRASDARWQLFTSAELLKALIYRATRREKLADASFRRVLRLDPQYQLDEDYYSPPTRSRFDAVRRELSSAKKARLSVNGTEPGADVYVDGRRLGAAPFSKDLVVGQYEVTLVKGAAQSLPRTVQLKSETELTVDLPFESAVHADTLPCIPSSDADELSYAVRLGALLDVEQLVVLSLQTQSAGPAWLTATLMNVRSGSKVREGGLKFLRSSRVADGLGELAEFVITGKQSQRVRTGPVVSAAASTVAAPGVTALPEPEAGVKSSTVRPRWMLGAGLVLGGAGLLGGVGGGVVFSVQSSKAWSRYDALTSDGVVLTDEEAEEASRAESEALAHQRRANIAFAVGGGALAAGAALVALDLLTLTPPTKAGDAQLTLAPAQVGVLVRLP